jgi:flagellar biosynthesis/type III secretory pathway chaperone
MSEHELASQLRNIFGSLVNGLTEMQTLLQQEHLALTDNNLDNITPLAKQKEKLSLHIERQESLRRTLLEKHQLPFGKNSLALLSRKLPKAVIVELLRAWDQVVELSRGCATQNQINGVVLAHQQRRTQAALRILRGHDGQNEIYSATGNTKDPFNQTSLARI